MPSTTEKLLYGGFALAPLGSAARCKGDHNCNTYGLANKDFALTIPKGEIALFVYGKDQQPMIYCKEHMKIVFDEMKKVMTQAKRMKLV